MPQVAVYDEAAVPALHEALEEVGARYTQIQAGPQAVNAIAGSGADLVLNGITGSVGLEPSIAALRAGSQLALANKESVVAGGHLLFGAQVRNDQINPVDSEHSAIWQSLRSGTHAEVSRLVVTASGGPFRGWKRADMSDITPEQALNHPTWHMGPVVTINSSTLMNKGLEVIEASRLFDVAPDRIVVTVHPQSIVHSMVEAFPAVALARECLRASEKHTAVLNAANEQAVHAFLDHRLPYLGIVDTVKEVVDAMDGELRGNPLFASVEEMGQVEREARRRADDLINSQK